MRSVYCTLCVFILIWGAKSIKYKEDLYNIYKKAAAVARDDLKDVPVYPNNISYYLFTNDRKDVELRYDDPEGVSPHGKIVFIIHGWTGSRDDPWYQEMTSAFLHRDKNIQVIQVDWRTLADQLYLISSFSVKDVGKFVGEFIVKLTKKRIPLENVIVVGHSLGGQTAGYVGKTVYKETGKKLKRIIALDPAGPFFSTRPDSERLNRTDAEVVHVLHTDGGKLGFESACGTIDFFPNGGSDQPGCSKIDILDIGSVTEPIMCDHRRAYDFYTEAVLNPDEFKATKCKSWDDFTDNKCEKETVTVGDLDHKKTGTFYLKTNSEKPYGNVQSKEDGILTKLLRPSKIL